MKPDAVEGALPAEAETEQWPEYLVGEFNEVLRYGPLLRNLVGKQLKLKYRGSTLGFVWSLLNPLSMVLVYTLVFRFVMRFPVENYALFLVAGVIHWEFFSSSIVASTGGVIENRELIRKVRFPRLILPAALVAFDLVQLILAFLAFMLIYVAFGGTLWWGHLLYPVVVLLQFFFVLGIAAFISASTVFLRDLQHLVQIALHLLFWLTPVIYPLTSVPAGVLPYYYLNPMTSYVVIYRDLLYGRVWPDPFYWTLALVFTAVSFVGGVLLFSHLSPRFAEEV